MVQDDSYQISPIWEYSGLKISKFQFILYATVTHYGLAFQLNSNTIEIFDLLSGMLVPEH